MDQNRTQRVYDLFQAALDLPAERRDAWLAAQQASLALSNLLTRSAQVLANTLG